MTKHETGFLGDDDYLTDFDYEPPTSGIDWFKLSAYAVLAVMTVAFWFVVLSWLL